jgi:hypothetical protein
VIRTLPVLVLAGALAAGCSAKSEPAAPAAAPSGAPAPAAALEPVKVEPSKDYPLKTCVVSGEELGAMGDRVAYKVGDVEVQLCCKMCLGKLKADPQKYIAMVTAGR